MSHRDPSGALHDFAILATFKKVGQAVKRVAIRFEVVETPTWDHSKLRAGVD